MGDAVLQFKPRGSLDEFVKGKANVSLIRRTGGRKSSSNMAIHGENLAALAALKAGFGTAKDAFKVDIITIDPPYNVGGNQGYKNTWKGQSEKERDWAGDHGAFLDFMEPRLKIGLQLLSDEGVMIVNICDGEYCRLKILMDQIFGPDNNLGTIVWDKMQGAVGSHLVASHEYILIYAKNKKLAPPLQQKKPTAELMIKTANDFLKKFSFKEAQEKYSEWVRERAKEGLLTGGEAVYSKIHPDNHRVFQADNSCAQDDPKGKRCRKPLIHPRTGKKCPVPTNGWKWKEETLDSLVAENKFWFGKDHTTTPRVIRYLDEQMTQLPPTVIRMASNGKSDLPSGISFATPKPVNLIKALINLYPKNDAVVLDYFGGSGTTGHAVNALNAEDGGKRSWILIEEMNSTFNKVMIPRIEAFDSKKDFSTYEVETLPVGGKELIKQFNKYSYDFLSSYHLLDEGNSVLVEGLNVLGVDKNKSQLVAITVPSARKSKHFFEEELAAVKQMLRAGKAKSVLIYTVHGDDEEPWLGGG